MKVTSCHSSDARHQEKAALCKYKNKQQTLPPIYHLPPAPKKTTTAPAVSQPPARGSDFSYRQEAGGLIESGVKNIKGELSLFRSPRGGREGDAQQGCWGTIGRCFGGSGGEPGGVLAPGWVGGHHHPPASGSSVPQRIAVAVRPSPGQGCPGGPPGLPIPWRVEKEARGASRSDLQECPQAFSEII